MAVTGESVVEQLASLSTDDCGAQAFANKQINVRLDDDNFLLWHHLASKSSSASSSRIQSLPFPDCTSATSVEPEVLSDLSTNQVIHVEQVQHEVSPQANHISQIDHVTSPAILNTDQSAGSETPVSGEASQEQMPMSAKAELDTSSGINDISADAVIPSGDEEGEVPDDVVDGAASVMVEVINDGARCQGNTHTMITRSKAGIYKPKAYHLQLEEVPASIEEALAHSAWKAAVMAEYQALVDNDTWELVKLPPH
ncbi:hypothetical protein V6N11_074874 [Hibiscus sabdariffa]|uniref:Uncharacterized protein n=1 Tax=Hibiscus sabdariffa TaxID=183260 RepID=A0ABR2R4V2_9ROSI